VAPTLYGTGACAPTFTINSVYGVTVQSKNSKQEMIYDFRDNALQLAYWPSRKRSPKRLCTFRGKNVEGTNK